MSVLLEMSMFPLEGSGSKSAFVAKIIDQIDQSGFAYKLSPMSTVVETSTMQEALSLVEQAYECLEECERVYACLKFDIRKNRKDGMHQKVASVQKKLNRLINA